MEALLASETDIAGFREEARQLLGHQVPPQEVHWHAAPALDTNPFAVPAQAIESRPKGVPRAVFAIVPASFARLCEVVVLHSDPGRFSLLYRLLWRLVHEPELRSDPLDPDMLLAQQMAQAVRRDLHKMKAFLRFRLVEDPAQHQHALHVAWFEPTHHIVEAAAPWFAKRYAALHWIIRTPERSVEWDGVSLHFGPGGRP